jgi:hypothetical protein
VTERQGLKLTRSLEVNVSKTTKQKNKVEIIVIIDPIVAIKFHSENESGKSGIRRGMPASPKKCIGKKHKLTPPTVDQKCIFPRASE